MTWASRSASRRLSTQQHVNMQRAGQAARMRIIRGGRTSCTCESTAEIGDASSSSSSESMALRSRRHANLLAGVLAISVSSCRTASADSSYLIENDAGANLLQRPIISLPAIEKERFSPASVVLEVPSPLWRSSGRVKENKRLLYTDTYGTHTLHCIADSDALCDART